MDTIKLRSFLIVTIILIGLGFIVLSCNEEDHSFCPKELRLMDFNRFYAIVKVNNADNIDSLIKDYDYTLYSSEQTNSSTDGLRTENYYVTNGISFDQDADTFVYKPQLKGSILSIKYYQTDSSFKVKYASIKYLNLPTLFYDFIALALENGFEHNNYSNIIRNPYTNESLEYLDNTAPNYCILYRRN